MTTPADWPFVLYWLLPNEWQILLTKVWLGIADANVPKPWKTLSREICELIVDNITVGKLQGTASYRIVKESGEHAWDNMD